MQAIFPFGPAPRKLLLRSTLVAAALVAIALGLTACGSSDGSSVTSGGSGASSSEISFVVDGTTTFGTLEIPAHRSGEHLAAALLIPGSGPTDRDGNDTGAGFTPDTLELIADLLARQGIASLRYDKYFAGKTGAGRFASDPGAATVVADLRQADAAYEFLRDRPGVDRSELLVVGHSEGGMVALSVADSVADRPAGLALLEPQDLRHLELVRIQIDEAIQSRLAQGELSSKQAREDASALVRAIGEFRAGGPVSKVGMSPFLQGALAPEFFTPDNANFTRSHDQIVPARLAAKVRSGTRVLVTDGTRDTNIPPATIGPLVNALRAAGTSGPGLEILRDTDHLMHLPTQPDSEAVLAPAVIGAITQWARPFASAP